VFTGTSGRIVGHSENGHDLPRALEVPGDHPAGLAAGKAQIPFLASGLSVRSDIDGAPQFPEDHPPLTGKS
jgi:hypothetical protein